MWVLTPAKGRENIRHVHGMIYTGHRVFLLTPKIICIPNYDILQEHYHDVIMNTMASQITSPTIVYSTVYSGIDQRKYQSSASLALVRGIHRPPVNSPHKGPVTRKMFSSDDVIMSLSWFVTGAVFGASCTSVHWFGKSIPNKLVCGFFRVGKNLHRINI